MYIPRGIETVRLYHYECTGLESLIFDIDVKKILSQSTYNNGGFSVYYMRNHEDFYKISIVQEYDPHALAHPVDEFWDDAEKYIYSETEPTIGGSFWHWVDGVPTPW